MTAKKITKRTSGTKKKPVTKKATSKPTTKKPVSKPKATRKVTKKAAATKRKGREYTFNAYGFAEGSMLAYISECLIEGAESREALIAKVEKQFGNTSRNGSPRAVTNSVSQVIKRMEAQGCTLHQPISMTPPKK